LARRATPSAAALVATLALSACGSIAHNSAPSGAQLAADFQGSPPQLAKLHAQANDILGGGVTAFKARLRALHGYAVVVNQWGSWCSACQLEVPIFQRVAAQFGRHVAFIGVDVREPNRAAAPAFLRRFPISYPSYADKNSAIAQWLGPGSASYAPVTYFYNRAGKQVAFWDGQYLNAASLIRDIHVYLGA
jgi:thiol-disulfide isomerase/thioredoxin